MTVWQDRNRLAQELDHLFGWDGKIVEEVKIRCETLARDLTPDELNEMLTEMYLSEKASAWLRDYMSRVTR